MVRLVLVIAVAFTLAAPALASEPGQPLDCSDWVFVEPGVHVCAGRVLRRVSGEKKAVTLRVGGRAQCRRFSLTSLV